MSQQHTPEPGFSLLSHSIKQIHIPSFWNHMKACDHYDKRDVVEASNDELRIEAYQHLRDHKAPMKHADLTKALGSSSAKIGFVLTELVDSKKVVRKIIAEVVWVAAAEHANFARAMAGARERSFGQQQATQICKDIIKAINAGKTTLAEIRKEAGISACTATKYTLALRAEGKITGRRLSDKTIVFEVVCAGTANA